MIADAKIQYAETMADLRGLAGGFGDLVVLAGYWLPGDGGGGLFYGDDAVLAMTDDGGTAIVTGGIIGMVGPGWRRIYSGALNVKWFGARGNDSDDDTLSIQHTIEAAIRHGGGAAAVGGVVLFPSGTYLVGSRLVANGSVVI